ncbi:MAG: bifunctional UDP-3-O-[3-hydroxymyristoyl] N-acetylglucosamine deacetylase/3-hydroxyacyl-ACP dehydratase [Saprospiraceae bacterium]|nr:bifunctional UDP-3-O-[3-hydroxymyristoyl] N-acetylglucosamine deacetylase/3-hydroxyacyl-ACP dehydratase [Saprospiraceae bacterium]
MRVKRILQKSIHFSGIGLHTGISSEMVVKPASEGSGIKFVRTDVQPPVKINADVVHIFSTNRGTTLKAGEATISTIEHLLAALSSLSIEDVQIEINGPEVPILDGSSLKYIEAFSAEGVLNEAESTRDVFIVREAFHFSDPETGSEYAVYPSDEIDLNVILEFKDAMLGDMVARLKGKEGFALHIADSRTFAFLTDIEPLFDAGLIKGGDIDNALVIIDKKLTEIEAVQLKKKLNKPDAVIEDGVISSTPLRHKNEPARHKLLDLIGDLTLVGREIQAKIIATKPGHTSNAKLAKLLKSKYLEQKKNAGKPVYDPNKEPLMTLEQIRGMLPHRYPFLLVDKVIELTDKHIVGIKNITFNEGFFQGHFPGNPIFPGVLQMEALAQTGGLFALSIMEDKGIWDTYFLKMENVKFKAKVVPGDTLLLKTELMSPIRRGIVQMTGSAFVGNKLVSEGELTAQIVKRQNDQ